MTDKELTPDRIREALRRGLEDVIIGTVKPGHLFQVEIPVYAPDGDGVQVYVEPHERGFRVTDMGATVMRASHAGDLTESQRNDVADLAFSQNLAVVDGAISAVVDHEGDLLSAVIGLAAVQVSAEAAVQNAREREHERDALRARLAVLESSIIDTIEFTGADATRHVRRKCLLCHAVAIDSEPLIHQKCWSNRADEVHSCPMADTLALPVAPEERLAALPTTEDAEERGARWALDAVLEHLRREAAMGGPGSAWFLDVADAINFTNESLEPEAICAERRKETP